MSRRFSATKMEEKHNGLQVRQAEQKPHNLNINASLFSRIYRQYEPWISPWDFEAVQVSSGTNQLALLKTATCLDFGHFWRRFCSLNYSLNTQPFQCQVFFESTTLSHLLIPIENFIQLRFRKMIILPSLPEASRNHQQSIPRNAHAY